MMAARGRSPRILDQLEVEVGVEQGRQLRAELQLRRVELAVGADELVDALEDGLLVRAIEALEELEAALLELRVDEGVAVLVLRERLVEELAHVRVDVLQLLAEVSGEARHEIAPHVGDRTRHAGVDAVLHELRDGALDELLLRRVEVAVDVAERREREDEGFHLPLGDRRVLAEGQHGRIIPRCLPRWMNSSPLDVRIRQPRERRAPHRR
ncbi:MAG: hypothetical protein M5U28_12835 [Sandaracinaceae bacterium]|nr:hypothetical protein [Sandaracinaceae bacterium]